MKIMWFLLGIVSALLLGCYDVSQKRALKHWNVIPVIFLSTLFSSLMLGVTLGLSRYGVLPADNPLFVPPADLRAHGYILLKAVLVLASWLFNYTALKNLPLTVFTPINATRPMWTLLGALLIFGEQLNSWQWAGVAVVLLAFYAFSVVDKMEGIHFIRNKYIWCVLLGTGLGALSGLYDKHLMRQFDNNTVQTFFTFYQCLMMGIVLLIDRYAVKRKTTAPSGHTSHALTGYLPILGISIFLTLADFAYFTALQYPESLISVLSVVRRAGAIVPFTYGLLIMRDRNPRYKIVCMLGVLLGMVFLFLGTRTVQNTKGVVISELMADNETGLCAADGQPHDWIELHNTTDEPIQLKGCQLQKYSGGKHWTLPDTTLAADAYMLIYTTKAKLSGQLHCDFKLSKQGDTLQLVSPCGQVLSEVEYKKLKADKSLQLTAEDEYKKADQPTPGFSNDESGYQSYLALLEQQRQDPLKIWEYMNRTQELRWVELKNTGQVPLDLSAYTLASKAGKKKCIQLPKIQLAPGQLYVIQDGYYDHAGRKKGGVLKGERLVLERHGRLVDALDADDTYLGITIGRKVGETGFFYFQSPTQGTENTTQAYRKVTKRPKPCLKPGAHAEHSVWVRLKNPDAITRYTTDGSTPTLNSPIFPDSLRLDSSTILRLYAQEPEKMRSPVATYTYILGIQHQLPVICLSCSEDDLYDYEHGIYQEGPHASKEFPHLGANYWRLWEKPAHVEFYDQGNGFSYDCGLMIFGGYSRALPKKSFRVKLHGYYGQSHVDYDLYDSGEEEHVKSFVLRSGSQDNMAGGVMVRDEYFTSLMKQGCPHMYVQRYRPVVVYLNAKYFGVYYIREKLNAEYVANHLGVDPESVTMMFSQRENLVGSSRDYVNLVQYACTHDMRDASVYTYMKKHVDLESLIDFKLGEFYFSNTDLGNIRYFRSSDPLCDGRWHWIFYDLDATFTTFQPLSQYIEGNSLAGGLGGNGPYNVLICQLLKNPEFRNLFLQHYFTLRKTTLSVQNQLKTFDQITGTIRPEMKRNCQRWPVLNYEQWKKNVARFRQKIVNRAPLMDKMFVDGMQMTPAEKKKYGIR